MKIVKLLLTISLLLLTQSMSLPPQRLSPGSAQNFEYSIDPGGTSFHHPPWSRSLEFQMICAQLPAHGAIVPGEPNDAAGTFFRQISILFITLSIIVSIVTILRPRLSLRGLHIQALVRKFLIVCLPLAKVTQ